MSSQNQTIELTPEQEAAFIGIVGTQTAATEATVSIRTLSDAVTASNAENKARIQTLQASIATNGQRLAEVEAIAAARPTAEQVTAWAKDESSRVMIEQLASIGITPATSAPVNQAR